MRPNHPRSSRVSGSRGSAADGGVAPPEPGYTFGQADYVRLQRHLDRLPVGFPATRSRVELRILAHIFTPFEARIAARLDHRPAGLADLHRRTRRLVASRGELAGVLDRMAEKGGIEATVVDGERRYANAPLVVGMYELQVGRLTPQFLRDFEAYTGGSRFGLTFLGTHLPQMRTIPVSRSVTVRHHVSRFDEVASLLREAEGPFVILECICRKSAAMKGRSCAVTDRAETCLGVGSLARTVLTTGNGREIDRSEALAIVERNQKEGLVLQPSNTRRAEFICSCCGCCCGMLGLQQALPKPLDFWATNFYAVVDRHACDGCGACTRRCQVGAVQVLRPDRIARIDRHRCIGCGLCVAACPRSALALQKKPDETRPPATRQELMDLLQAHRKGPLQRWMLAGKLLFDALRTRRFALLR